MLCFAGLALALTAGGSFTDPGDEPVAFGEATLGLKSLDVFVEGARVHALFAVPAGENAGGEGIRIHHLRSEDGGETWWGGTRVDRPGQVVHRPGYTSSPQIAAVGDRLLAVWTTEGDGFMGRGSILACASEDGGASWRAVSGPPAVAPRGAQAFLDLVTDARGHFHVVWLERRVEGAERKGLFEATSPDGGLSWSEPLQVDAATCECCWNRMVYSPQEQALYTIYRDVEPRDMSVARRALGSEEGWQHLGAAGAFDWQFEGCPHIGGGVAIGASPERTLVHTIVWTGHDDHAGVYYIRSPDGGASWEDPLALEPTAMRPSIASRGRGDVLMAWDGRESDGSGGVVRMRLSRDGGESWSAIEPLSRSEVRAEYPLVVSLPGGFRAFWMESDQAGKRANSRLVHLTD